MIKSITITRESSPRPGGAAFYRGRVAHHSDTDSVAWYQDDEILGETVAEVAEGAAGIGVTHLWDGRLLPAAPLGLVQLAESYIHE